MRDDLRVLEQVNPVPETDVMGWTDTTSGRAVFARVLERTHGDFEELAEGRKPAGRTWVLVVAAFAVMLLIGLPALLIDSGSDSDPVAGQVSLGADYVWPDDGLEGDPVDVARVFAAEVLGWEDASMTLEPGSDADGPVWVDIRRGSSQVLAVLTVPIGEDRRVLNQVGSSQGLSVVVDGGDTETRQSLAIFPIEGAVEARLHVRLAGDRQLTIDVGRDQLREGRVAIEDGTQVVSALIVYRNEAGEVIGASGGHFEIFENTQALTPREILDDGVVTESEYHGAALDVLTCLEAEGVDAGLAFDASGFASFTTRGEIEEIFEQCHGRHMGAVATAWADQNAPSREREIAFYNEVVDCVEEQVGQDYGEVEARSDTRATDAAIADAPEVYEACFDEVLNRYPGFRSSP